MQLGNDVGLTTAQLLNDREIPMNGFNTYFSGQGFNTDAIYIGYPTSSLVPVASKFSVIENVGNVNLPTFAGHFRNINIGTGATTEIIGIAGISDAPQAMVAGIHNIGGYFSAENAPFNTGVIAISSSIGAKNIGVRASASGSTVNYGVWASAPVAGTNRAGYFNGDIEIFGGPIISSDQMFKTNVEDIISATDILKQLKPHTYNMDITNFPQFNFQDRMQYGFIAQEVESVLPTLVHDSYMPSTLDSLGNEIHPEVNYKSLNYNALIPITVQAVNELNTKNHVLDSINQNLQTRLAALEDCINKVGFCNNNGGDNGQGNHRENNQTVTLQNLNSIILDQNLPNPFKENTVINYNIPTEVAEAKLLFYDLNGRIIKELVIEERGESKLTVYGTNLKTGIYTYSLIADGELIATKKMVKK